MKRWLIVTALAVAALALVSAATADPGDHGKAKGKSDAKPAKQKAAKKNGNRFTFTITTTDNGSCGTPWANDVVRRTFVVKRGENGSFRVTRYDRGTFTTIGGVSPGACDTSGNHGHTVRAGVTGKLVGYLRGTVTGGTFNPNATCTAADCGFTDVFLATFFGSGATFSCFTNSADCKFNFNYSAAHHQTLLFHHWQDKGKGAGTMLKEEFHGDIADA
jgi:hypothetical protein